MYATIANIFYKIILLYENFAYICPESKSHQFDKNMNQLRINSVSIRDIGEQIGLSPDSILRFRNQFGFDSDLIPLDAALEFLRARTSPGGRRTPQQAQAARSLLIRLETMQVTGSESASESVVRPLTKYVGVLYFPLLLATVASVANMYLICLHLCNGDKLSAWVLTAVFSGSALAFIIARATGWWSQAVMWVLIGFESFCNMTGVYYGLLGRTGTPTRFLSMVTDIFNSGTHYTAIALGFAMALIIGAVQIVSIKTIIRG